MTSVIGDTESLEPASVHPLPIELRFLLGDCGRPGISLATWLVESERAYQQDQDSPPAAFEHACACLYDSRLDDADEAFIAPPSSSVVDRAMLDLGKGKLYNLMALFTAADGYLSRAVNLLEHSEAPIAVKVVTTCFFLLNRSDLGQSLAGDDRLLLVESTALDGAAEAVRMHTLARLMLRDGKRDEALEFLRKYADSPAYRAVPALYQAHVARLVGVLYTLNGRPLAARHALRKALTQFEDLGYQRGRVRTALSLARTYGALDVGQARHYLNIAHRILQRTNSPRHIKAGGQLMPMEWFDYYARSGDVSFHSGDFVKAEEMYQKDVSTLAALRYGDKDALKRESGHAHRNLGKALVALGRFTEAAEALMHSSECFLGAGDSMSAFYSLCQQCNAELRGGKHASAASIVTSLESLLGGRGGRAKERAIVDTLRGHLAWLEGPHRASEALAFIRNAKRVLGLRRDYYYIQALLVEAQLLAATHDWPGAQHVLLEAWRRSSSADMADVRREVELLLPKVRLDAKSAGTQHLSKLQRDCLQQGNVRTNLTVLYADIRGFSHVCTLVDAHEMADFIREFAKLVSTSVSRNDGLPVRFLGDCVMALFGVHKEDEADLNRKVCLALEAAHEVYELFVGLRDRWTQHTPEFERVGLGFGIASGTLIAGTFGAAGLSEFSVIGEPVNLASRIQGVAADGSIMLCPESATIAKQRMELSGASRKEKLKGLGKREVTLVTVEQVAVALRHRESVPPAPSNLRRVPSAVRNPH